MYIKDGIPFSIVASGPAGLEIIFVSVLLSNNKRVRLGTFYRPPSVSIVASGPAGLEIIFVFCFVV